MDMLKYNETVEKIRELEKSLKFAQSDYESTGSIDQRDYAVYLSRLLKLYKDEHRKAAEREGEYAIR